MIILAVSGGIDSMVLLDKLYQKHQKIVIAHVNYQKRTDSYLDEIAIKDYIKDKDIILETLTVNYDEYTDDNFQTQARNIRYDFFCQLANKYHTHDIYLAHHYNDYLETYLFQKIRKGLYNYWGLAKKSNFRECILHRPLLDLSKKEIREYAHTKNIPFHEDSSNQSMIYNRNRLRKVIENSKVEDLNIIYQQSILDNKMLEIENIIINKFLTKNIYNIKELLSLDDNILKRLLFKKIDNYHISGKNIDEIIRLIKEVEKFENKQLNTTIVKNYGKILFIDCASLEYKHIIKNDEDFQRVKDYFKEMFDYEIMKSSIDYPYLIRNYQESDLTYLGIEKRKFMKKLMKNKVPHFLRDNLPIVEKNNEIIELI